MKPQTWFLDRMAKGHLHCVLLFVTVFLSGVSSKVLTGMRRVARSSSSCPLLKLANGKTTFYANGRTLNFRCNPGFQRAGPMTADCTNGKWNKDPPICVATGCSNVLTSLPKNLTVRKRRYSDTLISFTCDETFTMAGSKTIFCNGKEWNDTVPMCYATPTPATTLDSCDFERDLCEWSQSSRDDFDLARGSAPNRTGPSVDHTHGNSTGHFLYIETNTPRKNGDSAVLISQNFSAMLSGYCFQFWYFMYGGDSNSDESMAGSLEVFVAKAGDSLSRLSPAFRVEGNQRDSWHLSQVEIPTLTTSFQIVMNATRGRSLKSDVAIDDVTLFRCSEGGATTSVPTTETSPMLQTTTAPPAPETTAQFVESTKATIQSTTTKKDKDASGKPNTSGVRVASPIIVGKTGASKEDSQNSESMLPTIIGVSSGVGIVVVVVLVVVRMKKRKRNGAKTGVDDNFNVTAKSAYSFNSSARSTVVDVPNATVKNMP